MEIPDNCRVSWCAGPPEGEQKPPLSIRQLFQEFPGIIGVDEGQVLCTHACLRHIVERIGINEPVLDGVAEHHAGSGTSLPGRRFDQTAGQEVIPKILAITWRDFAKGLIRTEVVDEIPFYQIPNQQGSRLDCFDPFGNVSGDKTPQHYRFPCLNQPDLGQFPGQDGIEFGHPAGRFAVDGMLGHLRVDKMLNIDFD